MFIDILCGLGFITVAVLGCWAQCKILTCEEMAKFSEGMAEFLNEKP